MYQTSKDKMWSDEQGMKIPFTRTTSVERLMEASSAKLLKEAKKVNTALLDFKEHMKEVCDKVFQDYMESKDAPPTKGNFTWYNFDRSIKVEVAISDRIEFDDLGITACKAKLDEFIDNNVEGKKEFVKQLISEAFSTSRGKLDAKKVMGLLKYRSKIKDSQFQSALSLLEESIRRPDSKTYFRIWEKRADGGWENIDLNFSSL